MSALSVASPFCLTPSLQPSGTLPSIAPKRKRRRGKGSTKPTGPVTDCENIGSARLVSLFLRSLSPKEKGYALKLLLELTKAEGGAK